MHSFFFRKLQLITVLLLIRDSYMSWSTRFDSLKKRVGFFIFDSVLFLLKFTEFELLHKIHFAVISQVQWGYQRRRRKFHNFATLLGNFFFCELIRSFEFFLLAASQIAKGKPLIQTLIYIFVQQKVWTLWYVIIPFKIKIIEKIFKFQQEVWKFNDICVSWSSQKTDLETNVLNLKNWSFENVSFSQ